MKVVLDTNVLVAGLLSPFGPCGDIVRMIFSGKVTLCFDARVLSEYRQVLERPKFNFDRDKVAIILDYIAHHGQAVTAVPLSLSLPDPDDEPFVEIAIAGGADFLITHFPAGLCRGAKVVSPANFLKRGVRQRKDRKERIL